MIKTELDITYSQYMNLSEEDRYEYDFKLQFMLNRPENKNYLVDKDFMEEDFGLVKELQYLYDNNYMDCIEYYISYHNLDKAIPERYAWEVIITFEYIYESIGVTIRNESEQLTGGENKYSHIYSMVDFSMFDSHFCQRDSLANGDITKYDEIDKQPYSRCFSKLLYIHKNNLFEQMLVKQR